VYRQVGDDLSLKKKSFPNSFYSCSIEVIFQVLLEGAAIRAGVFAGQKPALLLKFHTAWAYSV
jgi:hypothetical protein